MNIEVIDNQRFSEIWVDGEKIKEISRYLYKHYLKEIFQVSSRKELRDLLLRIDIKIAQRIVYKLLAIKGYMKLELEEKLKTHKIDPKAIDEVLQKCEKLGYLNDQREGKLFVNRQRRKGWGPNMIALKLKSKAPQLLDLAKISNEDQLEMIRYWIEKKTHKQDFDDIKVKQKLYRFLKNKGFEETLVRQELFK